MLLDLGVTSLDQPQGFVSNGKIFAPLVDGQPALARNTAGELSLVDSAASKRMSVTEFADIRGGAPLVVDGVACGSEQTEPKVSALGTDEFGRVFFIEMAGVSPKEVGRRLTTLRVRSAMRLSRTPRNGARARFLEVTEGSGVEIDPLSGATSTLTKDRSLSTHLYFESVPAPARVTRLKMDDVELSPDEAQRQRRLVAQVNAMREELRAVENAKFKVFIEKVKARRGDAGN
jgi:hypothetical protein